MSANLRGDMMQPLDRRAEPEEQISEEQISDAGRMSRLLMTILRGLKEIQRRWSPQRLDFEDLSFDATGTATFSLPHAFSGRVRYWVVEWVGAASPNVRRHASSTPDVLVLTSTSTGVATIRVEEAG